MDPMLRRQPTYFVKSTPVLYCMKGGLNSNVLLNQTWVCLPSCSSQANLLTPAWDEGEGGIYYKAPDEESMHHECSKLELSDGFQENIFKGQVRDEVTGSVISSCTVL